MAPTLYDYEFTIWPKDREGERAVIDVFRRITPRTSLTMTEAEFGDFLQELHVSGLTTLEMTKERHGVEAGHSGLSRRAS